MQMVTVLKSGTKKREIASLLEKVSSRKPKGIDAYKYCGTVKFKEDGLALQKRLRDEWE